MKKILFLTASYPDIRKSASILCTHRVMECMAESGLYEVHALTIQYGGEKSHEIINNIQVHRFIPSIWLRLQWKMSGFLKRFCVCVQKIVMAPMFPQLFPVTTSCFDKAAEELHRTEGFDTIVSAHGGLITFLPGCRMMKRFTGLKHVAIMWDPVKGQIATKFLPKKYTDYRIDMMEAFVANYTTLQISTASMRDYHEKNGDIAANHRIYLDIPSILRPEPEVPSKHLCLLKEGRINIVFSGLLSPSQRDPRPIVRLLNKVMYAENINLVFFSMGCDDIIDEEAKSFKGTIVRHPYISLQELHTVYRHSNYLLNISHVNANMVPSKIFEYMSYGKPIISTFITDGDAAQKYVSFYREGLCLDLKKTESENVDALNVFMNRVHEDVTFEEVKELFKDNTPERFREVINEVIER